MDLLPLADDVECWSALGCVQEGLKYQEPCGIHALNGVPRKMDDPLIIMILLIYLLLYSVLQ